MKILTKDFWFSKFNIKHNLSHITIGIISANVYYIWSNNLILSLTIPLIIGLSVEAEQLRRHGWDFLGYDAEDQIRDVVTYVLGGCTIFLWGLFI